MNPVKSTTGSYHTNQTPSPNIFIGTFFSQKFGFGGKIVSRKEPEIFEFLVTFLDFLSFFIHTNFVFLLKIIQTYQKLSQKKSIIFSNQIMKSETRKKCLNFSNSYENQWHKNLNLQKIDFFLKLYVKWKKCVFPGLLLLEYCVTL